MSGQRHRVDVLADEAVGQRREALQGAVGDVGVVVITQEAVIEKKGLDC